MLVLIADNLDICNQLWCSFRSNYHEDPNCLNYYSWARLYELRAERFWAKKPSGRVDGKRIASVQNPLISCTSSASQLVALWANTGLHVSCILYLYTYIIYRYAYGIAVGLYRVHNGCAGAQPSPY